MNFYFEWLEGFISDSRIWMGFMETTKRLIFIQVGVKSTS